MSPTVTHEAEGPYRRRTVIDWGPLTPWVESYDIAKALEAFAEDPVDLDTREELEAAVERAEEKQEEAEEKVSELRDELGKMRSDVKAAKDGPRARELYRLVDFALHRLEMVAGELHRLRTEIGLELPRVSKPIQSALEELREKKGKAP